jgi:hypothetical protein
MPACDWLAATDKADLDDPLTAECSNAGSQLTGISLFRRVVFDNAVQSPPSAPATQHR